ncbi:MAG: MMPL family transporter [Deltaproteobacteria bacterium]|nr:MMPL family transporter [Deltaproteobacteria bacterium]
MLGRQSALAWCAVVVILCGFSAYQVAYHWRLQTDVLTLLPGNESEPATQSLRQIASGSLGRSALFLVGHTEDASAHAATRALGAWVAASPLFTTVHWDHSRTQQAFFELYFPFRYQMLSPSLRPLLDTPDAPRVLVERLTRTLYQPTSSLMTRLLADDPLLLFPALVQDWGLPASRLQVQEGLLSVRHEGRLYHAITAQLAMDPFATAAQEQFDAQWDTWVATLARTWPGVEVSCTSVVRFAGATRKTISRDIALISIGSILGVTLLILGTFQSGRHLVLALAPIVLGIWVAVGVTLWLFGTLHALTLSFGASLVGICDDYSFHYFAYHRVAPRWNAERTMRHLLPALSLGALTTILSFLGLAFTPLVGLQQIAVFASCGIVVSFGTVVFCFPHLLQAAHPRAASRPALYRGAARAVAFCQQFRKPLLFVYGLVVVLSLPGLWLLNISDSPRALNALPSDLQAQDQRMRAIMGLSSNQTYMIVEGPTAEDALQELEQLTAALRAHADRPPVELGPVLTSFLPSRKQQAADRMATQRLLEHRQFLTQELTQLGFTDETLARFFQTLATPPDSMLSPAMWLRHEASLGIRHLWLGNTTDMSAPTSLLVQVTRVNDLPALQTILTALGGIHYVDQVADFTRVFKRYRQQSVWLVGGAYLLIFAMLLWTYGRRGLLIMLPPVLAAVVTISVFGYLGHPFHLIHMLMLILILGMGVDFTIFIVESSVEESPTTLLAMTLSTLSTLLSFGLLGLSGQAVLQAIGLTVLIGVTAALVLSPLAYYGVRRPRRRFG